MPQQCLLGVFAHPDDESFGTAGTFRKYADQGKLMALICATKGEGGEISDPTLATPDTLGQVREQELRTAAGFMGIQDLTFLGYLDGHLAQADEHEAVGRIVREIRRLRPEVLVTFDANGVYGHPDHVAVHRFAVAAFRQAGDATRYPEHLTQGIEAFQPAKLYTIASRRSGMRTMRESAIAAGLDFTPGGNAATIPIDQMGMPDEEVTTIIPLSDREFEAKVQALRAHRTQMSAGSPVNRLPPEVLRAWLGSEAFQCLVPSGLPGNGVEHDLFAGLPAGRLPPYGD